MHRAHVAGAVAAAALIVPAAAQAHVTVQPSRATAGAYTVESIRVPNEQDRAYTTKVDVQFPPGFASASYQSTPGWKVTVRKSRPAKPIQTDDGPVTEQVSRVTWTADSKADGIAPGQFRDFPLSVKIPDRAGRELTFKALQTYSDGQIVRWIGAPDADTPAPRLTVLPASGTAAAGVPASDPAPPAAAGDGGKASQGLGIAALVLGAIGAVLGAAALLVVRRRPA